jgi:Ankyrin repeats (3 copies)
MDRPQDILPIDRALPRDRKMSKKEIAQAHGFKSRSALERHRRALTDRKSAVSRFERAIQAIIAGKAAVLKRLLREDPKLIHARSMRRHRATLLHYISANGVEGYRQKTPKNIIEIAKTLVAAGAKVDALANCYDTRTSALHLTATSVHPERAGVMNALLEFLIQSGASIDDPLLLGACLWNGRGNAAQFLAAKGAPMTLETAAGVGRLDFVEREWKRASKRQLRLGFLLACEYGHNDVAKFLIDRGADVKWHRGDGQTALHWAVIGGQLETVKLLLRWNPPLETRNQYGGTVVGQALWSAANGGDPKTYVAILDALARAGARVPAKCEPIHPAIDRWIARAAASGSR